ncbi:muconolactone Delta-isomerase family protein [Oceanicoccus sp. KOV_DT_Chl]|uniref:muconolactone Delta-isomerase family protein n=1 Tax=Oceanicoccus sp. KOV_DT_Chl TaxID=1904639 RepID=UPI000C7B3539|nr:muconolactone Delta-isomerase family protein [Oceanicoccus sp. KOV_DT_Chl]
MLFMLTMSLRPVPKEEYLAKGRLENEYTQQLMAQGIIQQFHVTQDHRQYWIVFSVDSEDMLITTLNKFPFYPYFDFQYHPVTDMVAAVADGMVDPNLE